MKFRIILLFVFAFNLTRAQNYLYNGDFELGGYGIGFNFNGAGYGFISPPYPGNTQPGDVAVAANPSIVGINLLSVSDHSGNGNMLIVDGGTIGGNQVFWQAGNNGGGVCGLTPGNPYLFSYWARSISAAVSGLSNQSDLIPVFNNANGIIPLNNSSLVPLPAAGWQNYAYEFTATNSCVNIALYDNNLSLIGNDFAIDDLSLMPLSSPLQIVASSTKPNCSDTSSGAIFAYPKGGYPPYTFQIIGPSGTLTNSSGIFTGLLAGNYSISLTDANNQTVSLNNQIVYPNDYLILAPQDTLVCPNSNVLINVSGGTNTNYSWVASPPDPTLLNSINDSILVSPNQSTTYVVSTNVLNENLIWNGNFEIQNNGFYSDLNYLNPNNPNGFQGAFGVTSNASFWEPNLASCVDHTLGNGIGNMMVVDGSTQGNVIVWKQLVRVETNKTYTFSYYTQSVDGNSPAILKVSLNGNTLGIDSLNNTTCSWQLHTYTWVSGNDSIAQLHIENLNQAAIGNDFAIDDIAFSTVRSCTNAATVQIQTAQQDLGLEYPPNICVNQAPINPILSPNTSPNGTYNATPGGLNIDPISGIINGLGSTPGIYNIVYSTSQCNSLASDTFQVMVNALPALLSLTGGAYNCQTETFDSVLLYLNAPLPANVNWTLNGTPQSTIMNSNPLYLGSEPGSYQLGMVTDLYCSNNLSGSILLDTLDIPQTPVIIGDTLICENEPPGVISLINANPNGVISWFSDPNLTQFIESGNMFYPDTDSSASYFVVQTVNGCISDMLSFSIQVVPCNLVIPSAFTPDGDGDNDHWEIIGLDGKYPLNQVSVYNRWGELIYLSQEGDYAASPWDGTYQGIDLPVGSYYYIIEKASDGSVEPVNGTITILRTP